MENGELIKIGKLNRTTGFLVGIKHLICRRENSTGICRGWVPGHGGDVWWVEHDDKTVGAYSISELSQ